MYLYTRAAGSWSELTHIGRSHFFGCSVTLANNTLAVGSLLEDGVAPKSGAGYVFR